MVQVQIQVRPIGRVETSADGHVIRLDPEFKDGLLSLDGYSHVTVLWWAHLFATDENRRMLQMDAPYTNGPERIGVFATRSPVRPNPIAISHVAVGAIDYQAGSITVPYIDAENESPVLDIKPYCPSEDRIRDAAVPGWCDHWPKWYEDSATFDWESEFNF